MQIELRRKQFAQPAHRLWQAGIAPTGQRGSVGMDDLLGELLGPIFEVVLEIVWAILSPVLEGLWWLLRHLLRGLVWLFRLSTRGVAAARQRPDRSTSRGSSSAPGLLKEGKMQDTRLDPPRSLRPSSNSRRYPQRPSPRQRRRLLRQFLPDSPTVN